MSVVLWAGCIKEVPQQELEKKEQTKEIPNTNPEVPSPEPPKNKLKKPKLITEIWSNGYLQTELFCHYDDKGRLNKIILFKKGRAHKNTYTITYDGDTNRIVEVTNIYGQGGVPNSLEKLEWTASYSYGKELFITLDEVIEVIEVRGKTRKGIRRSIYEYSFYEKNKFDFERLIKSDNSSLQKSSTFSYDSLSNISYIKKEEGRGHIYNIVYDSKNHPFKNVGIAFLRDMIHFPIFINEIVPMSFVNNPIEWTRGFNPPYIVKRTNMKYDADDFLIEYQEGNSTIKIEYTYE
ncbi:hypothetical protein [Capnocytophaga stomatis]|uniref:hypothetical protein n=1 Tax=Capnocytophaga stomatis TaxID=1848904 RepID=UPI00194F5B3D|nr:hypothetical protein [Capnocytophaga stomatis]